MHRLSLFKQLILLLLVALFDAYEAKAKVVDPVSFRFEVVKPTADGQQFIEVDWIFQLEQGWKIQHPHDHNPMGVAPQLGFHDSQNITNVDVLWPKKVRDFRNGDKIRLHIFPKDLTQTSILNMDTQFSVCKTECRYFHERLTKRLPSLENYHKGKWKLDEDLSKIGFFTLVFMLCLAFLGGFILNFMPCVLPVLSLKLMQITKPVNPQISLRSQTLATILGIYVSFWILVGLVIILKQLGTQVGWGFHFQEPLFILFMCVLMLIFGLNLLGFFEIHLPLWLSNRMHIQRQGWLSHFAMGLLATLLATPCTAPFLGTAVSFALSAESYATVLAFTAMATGFALPYYLILLFPKLSQRLPRPGAWMVWMRRVLGIGLLGTAVWLGSIWYQMKFSSEDPQNGVRLETGWEPFDSKKIKQYISENYGVFVDVTARWCVTCAANKQFILSNTKIRELLENPKIKKLRADWTSPSSTITNYLNQHKRYGIPFNAYYSLKCPQGYVFPEILSVSELIEVIQKKC